MYWILFTHGNKHLPTENRRTVDGSSSSLSMCLLSTSQYTSWVADLLPGPLCFMFPILQLPRSYLLAIRKLWWTISHLMHCAGTTAGSKEGNLILNSFLLFATATVVEHNRWWRNYVLGSWSPAPCHIPINLQWSTTRMWDIRRHRLGSTMSYTVGHGSHH